MSIDTPADACARVTKILWLVCPFSKDLLEKMIKIAEEVARVMFGFDELTNAEWALIAVKRAFVFVAADLRKRCILRACEEADERTKRRIEGCAIELLCPPEKSVNAKRNILDPECWDFRQLLRGEDKLEDAQDLVLGYATALMDKQEEALEENGLSLKGVVEAFRATQK